MRENHRRALLMLLAVHHEIYPCCRPIDQDQGAGHSLKSAVVAVGEPCCSSAVVATSLTLESRSSVNHDNPYWGQSNPKGKHVLQHTTCGGAAG